MPPPAEPAPLDAPIAPITGDTLAWALPELTTFATVLSVEVLWEAMVAGHDGWYRPREQRIAINTAMSVDQQAAAVVHELAHALVDLDRHGEDPAMDYAMEELVAESVAHVVCGFVGLDTSGNSIPYLAAWRESTAADAFERVAGLVDRLARRLEDALDPSGDEAVGTAPVSAAG
ncbi:zincin-like metallopeptidase domain-containing protein [Solirubrobacter ginsenosidimutans]|uniref:Zincin-like metallopeptidase domain-containing protein n=1 Tax=Solirubrobacter ginsenosidimutans TaxID=490573 RepID=A0A9X3N1B6_9ACTN|nr:zincin-like metallopeptidase domain-containing protein [Solirubrobacter ginsenosidimutans]MDA0163133.1 zincin-like metallopeptidase domain-containing protein [Solirubrobacter ginsenosidimutans]